MLKSAHGSRATLAFSATQPFNQLAQGGNRKTEGDE
jgi:hypothetical protein